MNVKYYGDDTLIGQVSRRVTALETSGFPIAKVDLTAEEYTRVKAELNITDDILALPLPGDRQVYFEVDGENPRLEQLKLLSMPAHGGVQ